MPPRVQICLWISAKSSVVGYWHVFSIRSYGPLILIDLIIFIFPYNSERSYKNSSFIGSFTVRTITFEFCFCKGPCIIQMLSRRRSWYCRTQENGAEKCNTVNGGLICLLKSSDPLDEHTEDHRQNWREMKCKCKNVQSRGCRVILGKVFPCSYRRRWGLFANFRRGFSEVHLCSGVGGFVWRRSVEENSSDNMLNAPPDPTRNGLSLMCCIHHQGVIFAFTHRSLESVCLH